MPLPPGTRVGTLPNGTLTWIGPDGTPLNADGTPLDTSSITQPPAGQQLATPLAPTPASQTAAGAQPAMQPAAQDTTARDALIAQFAADHKGQTGTATPVLNKPTAAQTAAAGSDPQKQQQLQQSLDTGFDTYTFGDGTSIDVSPDGRTQNQKLAASSTRAQTPQEILAQNGIYSVGNQVWQRNADGTYSQTNASQATQALADNKTQADTAYTTAQTQKLQTDNALAQDPTNQALQQQKTQADVAYTQAQTQKLAADEAVSQGNLAVAQGNLGVAQAKLPGEQAQTAATTASTQATAQRTAALTPGEVTQQQATLQGTQITNQAALAKLNQPTMLSTGTGPTYTYWDPATQSMQTAANPAYVPTDPGRMTAQLQQQATAQQQALQQQVAAGKITSDQAASQFDQYWNQNIEPVKGDIAAAQAKAQSALQYQQAQTGYQQAQTAMLPATLAQNASDAAQRNVLSMLPYTVGTGAATTPGITPGARGFPNVNPAQIMQNATYSLPNLQEIGRQGAAAALANISPTAAMHAQIPGPMGQPQQGMPDLNSMLNMNSYGFGAPGGAQGGPAQPMPAVQGAPAQAQLMPAAAPGGQTSYTNPGMNMAMMPGYVPPTGPQTSYTIPGMDPSLMPGAANPWGTYAPSS
jgi:hypothetical protein